MTPPSALVETITRAGQEHLFAFWDRLDEPSQRAFLRELEAVDWRLLASLHGPSASIPATTSTLDLTRAATPPCLRLGDPSNPIPPVAARSRGGAALAAGTVGAILVAGGQGSRLGCHGPKGLFPVGPVSRATLFEMLLGKLVAVRRRFGRDVPLAIMTSSATDAGTREFLAARGHCGLDPDRVIVFQQRDLPAIDATTGRLLLDGPGQLALAPDGHGGMLVALAESGGLDWFRRQGAEHLVSFQVDNPLARPLDPEFIGYHLLSDADFTTQVVHKREPGERVGVVLEEGGRHGVIEYSDISAELAGARLPDGRLRFHAGSIAVHAFTRPFLEAAAAREDSLPLHRALKAVPCLGANGIRVTPAAPNAIKFERFIFDLMPLAHRVCVVEVEAAEGFAPLKNPAGAAADAPEHVQAALVAQARRLLARAGVAVADGIPVELAADRILDETDILGFLPTGAVIDKPTVIGAASSPFAAPGRPLHP
jgi:UDP-N-acetylglucosamine/UDP-N-acetylgalactosamine diphosphorylase